MFGIFDLSGPVIIKPDKIIFRKRNVCVQMFKFSFVFIIIGIFMFFTLASSKSGDISGAVFMSLFFIIPGIIILIGTTGFDKRYIFDRKFKTVSLKTKIFYNEKTSIIANFKDIEKIVEDNYVKSYTHKGRKRYIKVCDLVIITNKGDKYDIFTDQQQVDMNIGITDFKSASKNLSSFIEREVEVINSGERRSFF